MSAFSQVAEALRDLPQRYDKYGKSKKTEDDWLRYWGARVPDIEVSLLWHLRLLDQACSSVPPVTSAVQSLSRHPKARGLPTAEIVASLSAMILFAIWWFFPRAWFTYMLFVGFIAWGGIQFIKAYHARWNQISLFGAGAVLLSSACLPSFTYAVGVQEEGAFTGFLAGPLAATAPSLAEVVLRLVGGVTLCLAGWLASPTEA